MECKEIIEEYIRGLKEGFKCILTEGRLRIITPYLYPDNDLIEIFVEDLGNSRIKVTDLGESFRHLHSQGFDIDSSPKRRFLAETIASRVNVEISNGRLTKIVSIDKISEAMFDIITAVRGIADLIYTSRTYEPGAFFDEVKNFLGEHQFKYEPKVRIKGSSNKLYTVDFKILNGKSSYLHLLSPKNVFGIKGKVDATVRMWLDIDVELKKISLLNNIDFTWKEPDVIILSRVSKVQFWSRRDELITTLRQ